MSDTTLLILMCGAVTFAARTGGYLVLSRFKAIHFRVAAALDAVPAAVMTTLVVPAAVDGGVREAAVLAGCALIATRLGTMATVLLAMLAIIALRAI